MPDGISNKHKILIYLPILHRSAISFCKIITEAKENVGRHVRLVE